MILKQMDRDCPPEINWKASYKLLALFPISFTHKCCALSYLHALGLQKYENTVNIPAVCLTSLRGGAERKVGPGKRDKARKRTGKVQAGQKSMELWAPCMAANYLLSEVISFRTAETWVICK